MSKRPTRYFLKEKEVTKVLNSSPGLKMGIEELLGSKPRIEIQETEKVEIFIIHGDPLLARSAAQLFPTLLFKEIFRFLPKIVVDMGAVSHVCNGADVMAPGVVDIRGDFKKNDLLLVLDEGDIWVGEF